MDAKWHAAVVVVFLVGIAIGWLLREPVKEDNSLYPGEPTYLLRASNKLAVYSVKHHADTLREYGLPRLAKEADLAVVEFADWHKHNHELSKIPTNDTIGASR
jgi:hypothetical protein